MKEYRVQKIGEDNEVLGEVRQLAGSPAQAAKLALGLDLVRGTGSVNGVRPVLRAKVYRDNPPGSPPSMVRLYEQVQSSDPA